MTIFDQYISSETEIDVLKMKSVVAVVDRLLEKYIKASKPEFKDTITDLQYVKMYIERCQNTIVTDQEINRQFAGRNADLESENKELRAKYEQLEYNFKELLEKWSK